MVDEYGRIIFFICGGDKIKRPLEKGWPHLGCKSCGMDFKGDVSAFIGHMQVNHGLEISKLLEDVPFGFTKEAYAAFSEELKDLVQESTCSTPSRGAVRLSDALSILERCRNSYE